MGLVKWCEPGDVEQVLVSDTEVGMACEQMQEANKNDFEILNPEGWIVREMLAHSGDHSMELTRGHLSQGISDVGRSL